MEQEQAERERQKEEEERRKRREEAKRRKRILEAAFEGENEEIEAVISEVHILSRLFMIEVFYILYILTELIQLDLN